MVLLDQRPLSWLSDLPSRGSEQMGNCCCHLKSPCDNTEERNGLLGDDSKDPHTGEKIVVGTSGPEGGDDMR